MPNQVTLTFAGESKPIEDSFDRVGASAKGMSDKVGGATREIDGHTGGLNRVGEAADNSERNLIGVHDVIDGTATIMKGPGKQGIVAYIQGWADLAGGLAPLIMSLAQTKVATLAQAAAQKVAAGAARVWTAAQWLMNTAMFASPITWIVVAIVALIVIIVLIAKKTDWFSKAWGAAWGWIKKSASNVWDWLKKVPGWIGDAFGKIANFITLPFRIGFNAVAKLWNNTIGRLSWTVPGWVPGIGGNSISVPKLPTFHAGGVVGGVPGTPTVAVLQAGEKIGSMASRGGGTVVLEIRSAGSAFDDALVEAVSKAVRRRGTTDVVLGGKR
jgi:hypothetical protein